MSPDRHHPAASPAGGGYAPFRDDDRLMAFLGQIGMRTDANGVTFKVSLEDGALNPLGILHGGALAAMFDVAMYEAAKTGGEVVTVAQEIKFLSAIRADTPLYIQAEILRAGRKTTFCTARATQDDKIRGYATAQYAAYTPAGA